MTRAPDALLRAITETKQLLAKAERNLKGAQKNSNNANAFEVEYLLQDLRALHTKTLALSAAVNREAIDRAAQSNHDPRNWIRRG